MCLLRVCAAVGACVCRSLQALLHVHQGLRCHTKVQALHLARHQCKLEAAVGCKGLLSDCSCASASVIMIATVTVTVTVTAPVIRT
jgi:hypothetical protein